MDHDSAIAPPFTRTACACPADIANCKKQPGHLIPYDVPRIFDLLGLAKAADARALFRASRGAVVGDITSGRTWRIGTITPRMHDGHCVFLNDANRCTIHAVAPFGCAFFDVHMSYRDWQRRSTWGLRQIDDPALNHSYESLRTLLGE